MLSSFKRLTKHSAVYGLGHIITRVVNFLLLPLYTNKLPTDEYGVSAVVFTYLALMTIVYTYGIDAAFLRFFILSDDKIQRRKIFSTAFWAVLIVAGSLTGIIYLKAATISNLIISEGEFPQLFRLGCWILLFDALAFLPFLFLRAEEKSVYFIVIKFVNVLINVGMNIWYIVYLQKGVEGIFLANAWASAITFFLLLPILFRQISFVFIWSALVELLKFGLPYLPSTLAVVLMQTFDRFILEKMAGLEVTGLYSAGYKLGIFMNLYVMAFRFAWHPFFLSTSKQENAKEIFSKILTYFTLLAAGIFLFISFFIDEIIRFRIFGLTIFGSAYWESTKVVPVILLAYLIYGMYVNFVVGIYIEKKTKYLPLISGAGAVVNIITNILLIPIFGMMGAAYASLMGFLVMAVMLYFFAQKFYTIPYEFGRLIKLALVVVALFSVGYYVKGSWMIFTKSLLVLGFPVILFLTGFFERRELDSIKKMVRSKFGKAIS